MFGKIKVTEVLVKSGKEVAFKVRASAKGVEIEDAAGTWCQAFSANTFECGAIQYYIDKQDNACLLEVSRALFLTTWFLHDAKLIKEFYQALERSMKRMTKFPSMSKIDDDITLAEDQVLHEKDEESVNLLTDLKKRKENGKKHNRKR